MRFSRVKAALAAAALAAAVATGAEFGLRALGRTLNVAPPLAPASGAPLEGGLWCLGDSFTQGGGAPPGAGFPERLDELLRRSGSSLRVVNLGFGGSNSSQQLALLESSLPRGNPRVVVYMGGGNDSWSVIGADRRLLLDVYGVPGVVYAALQRSRLFRVGVYVAGSLARGLKPALRGWTEPHPHDVASLLRMNQTGQVIELLDGRPALSAQLELFLAGALFAQRRYARAERLFSGLEPRLDSARLPVSLSLWAAEAGRLRGRPVEETLSSLERAAPGPRRPPSEAAAYWLGRGWAEAAAGRRAAAERAFVRAREAIGAEGAIGAEEAQLFLVDEAQGWSSLLAGRAAEAARRFRRVESADPQALFAPPFWAWVGAAWLAAGGRDEPSFAWALGALRATHPEPRWDDDPLAGAWICAVLARDARLRGDQPAAARWRARGLALHPLRTLREGGETEPVPLDLPARSFLESLPPVHFLAHLADDPSLSFLRRALRRMLALSRRRGFRLALMTYPSSQHDGANAVLREFARENGLELVDLPRLVGDIHADRGIRSEDGVHPNAQGYARIAAALQRSLKLPVDPGVSSAAAQPRVAGGGRIARERPRP